MVTLTLFLFLKACCAGMIICFIIGPIAILFVNKTIEYGVKGALAVGIGASLADAVCGCIAAFSLSSISEFIARESSLIKIFGGLILLYISYKDLASRITSKEVKIKSEGFYSLIAEVFFLTAASPLTIGGFVAVFSSLSAIETSIFNMVIMTLGVLVGSIIWWTIFGIIILKIRDRLSKSWIIKIRLTSSAIIGGCGLFMVFNGLCALF